MPNRCSIFSQRKAAAVVLPMMVASILCITRAQEQEFTSFERERARDMLRVVQDDIKKYYYDPKFHGLDVDARFDEARKKIDSARSLNYALADIAGAVSALDDSHTSFVPPSRPYKHSYGWHMQAIGDSDCFITAVRPGSDAGKKGLKPGDQVLSVDGHPAIREDVWKIDYVYGVLRPQPGLRMILRSPDGNIRQLDVMASFQSTKRVMDFTDIWDFVRANENDEHLRRPRYTEYGNEVIILKLHDFVFDPSRADEILDKVRRHNALILDLRGNPGGYVEALQRFLGGMFDHEIKIADRVRRKEIKPQMTKSRGHKAFNGKLVVLTDSRSASAAEIFARVIQLERRGTVIGDRSNGMVMESKMYQHQIGMSTVAFYGVRITDADLVMTDGKSLEHVGVIPDERLLPSPVDLAAGRDPALARAAELVGITLSPEEAGKLFPVEWPPQ